jgi:hypothetical protein
MSRRINMLPMPPSTNNNELALEEKLHPSDDHAVTGHLNWPTGYKASLGLLITLTMIILALLYFHDYCEGDECDRS